MSANVRRFRAGLPAGGARSLYPDAQAQLRLAAIVVINLTAVAACFFVENLLLFSRARLDSTTPGWCFILAQAGVLGFVIAMTVCKEPTAVVQSLLAATLIGYAYALAGAALRELGRVILFAPLIYRAVQLGLVAVAAMALGISLRLVLGQRLQLAEAEGQGGKRGAQYHLGELMFLTVVFAIALGFANLFFNHYQREQQLWEIVLSTLRSLPAALPWLWGVMQRRLSWSTLVFIVAGSVALMFLKAGIDYTLTDDDFSTILEQAGRRAAAYAAAATLNGLLLRGLGFQWRPG